MTLSIDELTDYFNNGGKFTVLDMETTGFDSTTDRIIEFAYTIYAKDSMLEEFSTLINPGMEVPENIRELTGISSEDIECAPSIKDILPTFLEHTHDTILTAHHESFDENFLINACHQYKICGELPFVEYLCTATLAEKILPSHDYEGEYNLDALTEFFDITHTDRHRANSDVKATWQLFNKLMQLELSSHNRSA